MCRNPDDLIAELEYFFSAQLFEFGELYTDVYTASGDRDCWHIETGQIACLFICVVT